MSAKRVSSVLARAMDAGFEAVPKPPDLDSSVRPVVAVAIRTDTAGHEEIVLRVDYVDDTGREKWAALLGVYGRKQMVTAIDDAITLAQRWELPLRLMRPDEIWQALIVWPKEG